MTVEIVRDRPFTNQEYQIECEAHDYPWPKAVLESCQSAAYWRFTLLQGDCVMGYLIAHHVVDEVTLMNIAVNPVRQRQGYGRQLLQHLITHCKTVGICKVWLEVRISNASAIRLYEHFGFSRLDLRKQYYAVGQQREDALVMCLKLPT